MYLTIRHNSGGNHGHQLKDTLGGMTIAKVFDLRYRHRPYPYLDFFGLGHGEEQLSFLQRHFGFKRVVRIKGPFWDGFESLEEARAFFLPFFQHSSPSTLFVLERAVRIHPCQAIAWHRDGAIERNVYRELSEETSRKFRERNSAHPTYFRPDTLNIAMHINRGEDCDRKKYPFLFTSSRNVRYMFPMRYYRSIYDQLMKAFADRKVECHVYTERLNSEEIVEEFRGLENVRLHTGSDRSERDLTLIHDIFYHFVTADILVACNSSFSAICAYFRHGKVTIYHAHKHLFDLPEDRCFETDVAGSFEVERLRRLFA